MDVGDSINISNWSPKHFAQHHFNTGFGFDRVRLSHKDTKIYGCNAEERAVIDGLLAEESSFRDNGLNPVFVSKMFSKFRR